MVYRGFHEVDSEKQDLSDLLNARKLPTMWPHGGLCMATPAPKSAVRSRRVECSLRCQP